MKTTIAALQMDLAQAWGVASLKIRHHQQFGFLAEVPAAAGEKLMREGAKDGPQAPAAIAASGGGEGGAQVGARWANPGGFAPA